MKLAIAHANTGTQSRDGEYKACHDLPQNDPPPYLIHVFQSIGPGEHIFQS